MNNLTEYQNTCRLMYTQKHFDMPYIINGFVDNELDSYKPMFPSPSFETKLKIYIKYMAGDQYQKKGTEARDKDKHMFEHDNKDLFAKRNEVITHNKRCFDILTDFFNDLDPNDLPRKTKLKSKIYEFERIINAMPEYKEPSNIQYSSPSYAVFAVAMIGLVHLF